MTTRKKSGPAKRKPVAAKGKGGKKAIRKPKVKPDKYDPAITTAGIAQYLRSSGDLDKMTKQLASHPMSPMWTFEYRAKPSTSVWDGLLKFLGIKPQHSHKDEF